MTTPRKPIKCGRCTMFGHNRRRCHLSLDDNIDSEVVYNKAMENYAAHCYINSLESSGPDHTVPRPKKEDFIKKTPFELACENGCKITKTDDCCICMETLGEKNKAITACGHQFHYGCLSQHTAKSNSCPMCRAVICPEIPKQNIVLPEDEGIYRAAARSTASLVNLIEELGVGDESIRQYIGEGIALQICNILTNMRDAIRTQNQ